MTTTIVPIDKAKHANLRVNAQQDFAHAANHHLTRVTANEIALASMDYPVVIIQEPGTDRFHCAAMFGFENGENLYYRQPRWRATYVPANVTIVPFGFTSTEPGGSTLVPGIIEDNPYVTTDSGQPLFDQSGDKTEFLKAAEKDLETLYQNEVATQQFVGRLRDLDLLRPFSLDLAYAEGRQRSVVGMHTVSNERLAALQDSVVLEFFKNGYLVPIYAMLGSLSQVNRMVEYRNELDGPGITGFEFKFVPED